MLSICTISLSVLLFGIGATPSTPSHAEIGVDLPVHISDEHWRPLHEHVDARLEAHLESVIRSRPQWRALLDQRKLAIGLVDMTAPAAPRFARIHGEHEMYAASLPKIAILLSAHCSFQDGTLERTPQIERDLHDMIRISSNAAATRMIDRVGLDRIEKTVRSERFGLYDPAHGGGLWVGKPYGRPAPRRGDPVLDLSHTATVTQICRFYYLVSTGRMIDAERSGEILEFLADPGLHHKFVNVLEERAPRARLFRKSGTWRQHHSDSVLVWSDGWRRYILAAMVESTGGEQILRRLLAVIEDEVLRAPTLVQGGTLPSESVR